MLPQVRAIIVTTLPLALWAMVDGVHALVMGRYIAREIPAIELPDHPGAALLSDGRVFDYGAWAAPLLEREIDPAYFAPFFVFLGVTALVGLYLFLCQRGIGWLLLVVFALSSLVRGGIPAIVAVALLFLLLIPPTWRLFLGGEAIRGDPGEAAEEQ